jgi:error-prone DNA polymerase
VDKAYLPRRHGVEPVTYLHPWLENALRETLGVILYQEQVLKVAHDLAGMSYAEADGFRRAMTHDRSGEEMEKMRHSFISRATSRGVSLVIAEEVFEQLAAFAAYGFCKAHAAAYAILSYQTLWLKYYYPAEFVAAVLSNQPMGYYPPRVLIADAKRAGVVILHPDVNRSSDRYTVEDGAIRISLRQVKGMTEKILTRIFEERSKAKFTSLQDFAWRTNLNRSFIERLVMVGAFDSLGNRAELLIEASSLPEHSYMVEKNLYMQLENPEKPVIKNTQPDTDLRTTAMIERKFLSLDISCHPLDMLSVENSLTKMKDLSATPTGEMVTIAGSVIRYQTPPTRGGKRVVYIIMEDGSGLADVTVFNNVQEKCGQVLFREAWLLVRGRVQRRGPKSLSIIADDLTALSEWTERRLKKFSQTDV